MKRAVYFYTFIAIVLLFASIFTLQMNRRAISEIDYAPVGVPETKVWFGPTISAQDYYNMSLYDNLWPISRRNVDGFRDS